MTSSSFGSGWRIGLVLFGCCASARAGRSLTPELRVADFGSQYEVEVRIQDENVLRTMSAQDFYRQMERVGPIQSPADYEKAVERVLSASSIAPCLVRALSSQ